MIKLIISDFDGVLMDLKEIHFNALNKALAYYDESYVISHDEHLKIFDGLPTDRKLQILSNNQKKLPEELHCEINALKQKYTTELIQSFNNINYNIKNVIEKLLKEHYRFYVASNAKLNTISLGLDKLGILSLVDKIYSNDDVKKAKPSAEMYLRCMIDAGVDPHETLIIEDSKNGREAAVKSGAYVCGIDNSFCFTYDKIKRILDLAQNRLTNIKWAGKSDVNILIPMAGAGKRFSDAGFGLPKPLIDVNGKPMIQCVVDNLNIDANFIFVVQKEHYHKFNLETYLNLIAPNCKIILTDGVTEGAACTTLLAKEFINNDSHLIIANSDQLVEWDSCEFMHYMLSKNLDGGILTFVDNNPKWSYALTDDSGYVTQVAEKKVISNEATVGIYYWKTGSEYVRLAEQMISKNIRVNNEFYVCPVFNEACLDHMKIKTFPINTMHGLGTPEDLKKYLNI
jgi:HAD superfamily hydrolase (TIGR01509 family)